MHNILHRWKCQTRFSVVANPGPCGLSRPWSAAVQQYLLWMCFEALVDGRRLLAAGVFAAFDTIEHKVPSGPWCALVHTEHQEHGQVASSIAEAFGAGLQVCDLEPLQQPPVQRWDGQSHRRGRGHIPRDVSNTLKTHDFSNILSQPRISSLSKKSKVRLDGKNGCSYHWYQRKKPPYLPCGPTCKTKAGDTL